MPLNWHMSKNLVGQNFCTMLNSCNGTIWQSCGIAERAQGAPYFQEAKKIPVGVVPHANLVKISMSKFNSKSATFLVKKKPKQAQSASLK